MGSHTTTGEWQSFEVRMRHRRADRLMLRAEAAVEAGLIDEARAAVEEIRTLLPRLPGLADIERRIEAASAQPAVALASIPSESLPAVPPTRQTVADAAQPAVALDSFPSETSPAVPPTRHTGASAAPAAVSLETFPSETPAALPRTRRTVAAAAQPAVPLETFPSETPATLPRTRRTVAAAGLVALLGASAAAGTWLARTTPNASPPHGQQQGADIILAAEAAAPTPAIRVETEPLSQGQISVFQSTSEHRDLAPRPGPPPVPATASAPATQVVETAKPEPLRALPGERGQISIVQPHAESPDLNPPGALPAPTATAAATGAAAPATPPPATPAPATPSPATPPNDAVLVRGVLDRYAAAYSRLDVNAASDAWPTVNRAALSRAFEGLASQQVSLANCDVTIDGASARAACSGTARWRPKIGGGEHTDARAWIFDLSRGAAGWRIVSARVQNR